MKKARRDTGGLFCWDESLNKCFKQTKPAAR